MYRKVLSYLERNTIDEDYSDAIFFKNLLVKHQNLLNSFENVEFSLLKDINKDFFIFTNGHVPLNELSLLFFGDLDKKHFFAKNELSSILKNDLTSSTSYNVHRVLDDSIEEFEVFTDNSQIIFRNDKILFMPSEDQSFDIFSISSDYLVVWFDEFKK